MQRDFQTYAAQGVNGWQNCTDYYNDLPSPYWNWLAAQLMWNPASDGAALDRDFYEHYYGAAAKEMQPYFATLWNVLVKEHDTDRKLAALHDLQPRLDEAVKIARNPPDESSMGHVIAARAFHQKCMK
jgi:hypothetical protein